MTDSTIAKPEWSGPKTRSATIVLTMVCVYMFLIIERPWESIRYLNAIPIERTFAIAMIVVAFLHGKMKTVTSPTNKWVYGLLALHFLLAPSAFRTEYAVDQGIIYAKMVVLYMLMLSTAKDEGALRVLVKAYAFSMIFYVTHSLWEYSNGRHEYRMGISRMIGVDSTFNDPNAFGASIVLSLPFIYALLRTETSSALRWLYRGYFLLAVACVVLTGSRSSFVGLIFLLVLWGGAQKGKQKLVVLTASVLAIGILWITMPEEKKDRIRTLWDENAGPANAHESAQGRLIGFNASWKMFTRVPLTGVGAGGKNYGGYRYTNQIDGAGNECDMQAHVLYGEVLAEFGVFGAMFFAGLVASTVRCCLAARKKVSGIRADVCFSSILLHSILCSLALLLLFGFGGHNFYRPMWLWLAAWGGAIYRLYHEQPDRTAFMIKTDANR